MNRLLILSLSFLLGFNFSVSADTTDQKWMKKVEITKTGMHCADDANCFNRYHPDVPPKAKADIGDMIIFHTRDALDTEFRLDSIADDLATVYRKRLRHRRLSCG